MKIISYEIEMHNGIHFFQIQFIIQFIFNSFIIFFKIFKSIRSILLFDMRLNLPIELYGAYGHKL